MIKENVTFTCRIDGTDNTEQRTVTLGYCFATEMAYKDLSGEDIAAIIQETIACVNAQPARMPDRKRSIYLVLAAVMAYYQGQNEDAPIKDTDLMNEATPIELGTALGTIINLWAKFYNIPKGEPAEKPAKGKGKAKN
jgi:hypothetical protein